MLKSAHEIDLSAMNDLVALISNLIWPATLFFVGWYLRADIVSNGNEGFAVKVNAYGPMLCEARVVFHDGSEAITNRYLDFEGTGYKFDPKTLEQDSQKLLNRVGA